MADKMRFEDGAPLTLSRRTFLKWSAVVGGTAVLVDVGLPVEASSTPEGVTAAAAQMETRIVWNSCMVNCGSRCPLKLHVQNDVIVRVETDDLGDDVYGDHQVRACVRGRAVRQRVYDPDRLKYPMKRVGKRGEGKFERITWEEAFDTIANKLKEILEKFGNEAVYINYATGTLGGVVAKSWPPASSPIARLMNCVGGYLNHYGTYSTAQISAAMPYTYGSGAGNAIDDLANSRLVILWGNDPGNTRMSGGGVIYHLQQAKKLGGAKVISINPLYTDTDISVTDEWIPIRPGTDAALVSGMAYVMISENLHDQAFLDKYCIGFDEEHMPEGIPANNSYKSYILGLGADQTPKTPEWAANITGIPAERIVRLAREIAQTKPCAIIQGWGPQRHANGEQSCRAIAMMAIMTGNVGIVGGGTGAREGTYSVSLPVFQQLENPVKTSISVFNWYDAIVRGTEMTAKRDGVRGKEKLDVPIKFMWNYAGNCIVNQHSDHNETIRQLQDDTKCEMIVVIENHMTSSAKVADILLPDITNFEQNDMTTNGGAGNMGYAIFAAKAIEPMYECKSVFEMCAEIARRLGVEAQYSEGRTQDEWLAFLYGQAREKNAKLPDFETFKAQGIYKEKNAGSPSVALKAFRDDPEGKPLTTPSGKIEIFSPRLHELGQTWELPEGEVITGLPVYAPEWEGVSEGPRDKYPLQMIGHHYKQRTHSTYGNSPWMNEVAPQTVWINPIDADARGIKHGDRVQVFNDRGTIELPARVTLRIMPGVISVPQGAWFNPDSRGVDVGGSVNTLTALRPSPLAKGNPQHTNLAQVRKA